MTTEKPQGQILVESCAKINSITQQSSAESHNSVQTIAIVNSLHSSMSDTTLEVLAQDSMVCQRKHTHLPEPTHTHTHTTSQLNLPNKGPAWRQPNSDLENALANNNIMSDSKMSTTKIKHDN